MRDLSVGERKRSPYVVLFLLLMPLVSGCSSQTREIEKLPAIVRTEAVTEFQPETVTRFSAAVNPANQVDVSFKSPGYVKYILQVRGPDGLLRDVQPGDFVRRGTVLAGVRQDDYQMRVREQSASLDEMSLNQQKTQGALAEAQAALVDARLDFNRADELYKTASMTKPDYDASRSRLDVGEARVAQAKAQIEANKATERRIRLSVAEAGIALGDTSLRAPIDGVVIKRSVENGALVGTGSVGFTIAKTSSVKVSFGVPDVQLNEIKVGNPTKIISEAVPGKTFIGRVTEISPAADPSTRVFNVEVTIPNEENLLKVGMITSLALDAAEPGKQSLVVPLSSIVRSSASADGYSVFVVRSDGSKYVAEERPVQVGDAYGQMIAVIQGIKSGEQVVTTGNTRLISGEEVKITD